MPLPVAYALLGAAVCVAADRDGASAARGRIVAAVVLVNGADLDFLPGLLVGDPHRFHRMQMHSLGWAILMALIAGVLVHRSWSRPWPLRPGWPTGAAGSALIVGILWATHALLDSLNADYSDPVGVMLFWPVSRAWIPSLPLFYNVEKVAGAASLLDFGRSLLTWHNFQAMALELAVIGPVLVWAIWSRRRH